MYLPLAISTFAIVLIVLAGIVSIALLLGFLGVGARNRRQAGTYAEHVAAADSALEQARAGDRGWHRDAMETAAREALGRKRPGWAFEELHLVLVEDQPGVQEDRAHFVAVADDGQEAQVVLARDGDDWHAESVD